MLYIQGTDRIKKIAGLTLGGTVETVPDLVCPRKHMIDERGWKTIRKAKNVFAFVSSPEIYKQPEMRKRVKGWCHPFRNSMLLPRGVPSIMMPESDFVDKKMVSHRSHKKIYDYCYFTINATPGIKNKGLRVFLRILPELCKFNLKGVVIVYYPNIPKQKKFTVNLSKEHRDNLRQYDKHLEFYWGLLNSSGMDQYISSSRFGLFPNTIDNSPRIIPETLVRDVPILVNHNIHGGWHYVNQKTGALFKESNLSQQIRFMMEQNFDARNYYSSNYGFERSSKRLCKFVSGIFGYTDYTHMYFDDYKPYL